MCLAGCAHLVFLGAGSRTRHWCLTRVDCSRGVSPKPCICVWHDALIWYFLGRGLEPVIGVLYVLIAHVACSLLLCSNRSGWQDRKYKGKRPCAGLSFRMVFIPCPCLNRRQASLTLTLYARRVSPACVMCRALFVCSVIYVHHTCVREVS